MMVGSQTGACLPTAGGPSSPRRASMERLSELEGFEAVEARCVVMGRVSAAERVGCLATDGRGGR